MEGDNIHFYKRYIQEWYGIGIKNKSIILLKCTKIHPEQSKMLLAGLHGTDEPLPIKQISSKI